MTATLLPLHVTLDPGLLCWAAFVVGWLGVCAGLLVAMGGGEG